MLFALELLITERRGSECDVIWEVCVLTTVSLLIVTTTTNVYQEEAVFFILFFLTFTRFLVSCVNENYKSTPSPTLCRHTKHLKFLRPS